MPLVPIAAFLTGALLSLLMPTVLLSVLAIWYWKFSERAPETAEADVATTRAVAEPAPGMGNPGPSPLGPGSTSGER